MTSSELSSSSPSSSTSSAPMGLSRFSATSVPKSSSATDCSSCALGDSRFNADRNGEANMLPPAYETAMFLPVEAGRDPMTKDAPAEGLYENESGHYVDMTSPQSADCEYVLADTTDAQQRDEEEEDEEHVYEEIDCWSDSLIAAKGQHHCQKPPRPKPPPNWRPKGTGTNTADGVARCGSAPSLVSPSVDGSKVVGCPCECQAELRPQLESEHGRSIDDCATTTQLVRSLADLKPGDHVTWKRSAGIWHHAIVVNVDAVTGQLEVVHYNGSVIRDEGQSSFASVRREWVSVSLRSRDLYRVDYDSRMVSCFSPEVVVQRAMSRINETEYNPLTHNCEHLARWCKTGQPRSVQVERLPSRLHAATGKLADHVSSTGLVSMIKSAADKIPFSSAAAAAEHVVHVGARGIYSRVGPHVGRLAKSAVDLQETMTDGLVQKLDKMNEAYQQTIGQNGS